MCGAASLSVIVKIKSPRCNAERFGGFDIDGHVKFGRLNNWQIPAATPLRCFNRVR